MKATPSSSAIREYTPLLTVDTVAGLAAHAEPVSDSRWVTIEMQMV